MKLIVFIAPPGAGKGTQAELISKKFDLVHLETSKIIEEKLKNADPDDSILSREKKKLADGELAEPSLVAEWFLAKIRELAGNGKGVVLSGSPRTLYEAKTDMPVLDKLFGRDNIKIFNITLSEEESIKRNSARRICQKNRHPVPNFPEYADISVCPFGDGSPLITRVLDKPEIIKERYRVYQTETEPVLDYLKSHGYNVDIINGEQSIEKVNEDIMRYL